MVTELHSGNVIETRAPILSGDSSCTQIPCGARGTIISIDEEGDAEADIPQVVDVECPAHFYILKEDFDKLFKLSKISQDSPSIDCEQCGSSLIGRSTCSLEVAICTICPSVKSSSGPPVSCLDCASTPMAFGHSLDAATFETPSDDEVASQVSPTDNQQAKRV